MTADQHAAKVITDDTFLISGRQVRIPTQYYQEKIGLIASTMEFENDKLTDDADGTKYAIMLNSKYAWKMTQIIGCILYGRNRLYDNFFTRPLSYVYMKFKTRQLFHTLSNAEILKIFVDYISVVGVGNFTNIMTFLEMLMPAKKD